MIHLKAGVYIYGLTPEMVLGIMMVSDVFRSRGYECVITSALDGVHPAGPVHKDGRAVDFRLKHIPDRAVRLEILGQIKGMVGDQFDAVLEDFGGENEHIHLEVDPHSGPTWRSSEGPIPA